MAVECNGHTVKEHFGIFENQEPVPARNSSRAPSTCTVTAGIGHSSR